MNYSGVSYGFGLIASAATLGTHSSLSGTIGTAPATTSYPVAPDIVYSLMLKIAAGDTLTWDTATAAIAGSVAATYAGRTLTFSGNAVADETVTIGSVAYTWKASVTTTANEVKVGVDTATSVTNLINAITLGAGSGTLYGSATVEHPLVDATGGISTIDVVAKSTGIAGNSIATTETMTNAAFGGPTLTGGLTGSGAYRKEGVEWAAVDPEGLPLPVATKIYSVLIQCADAADYTVTIASGAGDTVDEITPFVTQRINLPGNHPWTETTVTFSPFAHATIYLDIHAGT